MEAVHLENAELNPRKLRNIYSICFHPPRSTELDMVIRKNAKPTEPKQSTHARGVHEPCGGLGEPILHHIYENFPRKYPNFLNWA